MCPTCMSIKAHGDALNDLANIAMIVKAVRSPVHPLQTMIDSESLIKDMRSKPARLTPAHTPLQLAPQVDREMGMRATCCRICHVFDGCSAFLQEAMRGTRCFAFG